MIINRKTLLTASLLALFAPAASTRADVFQWQYINPANPSQGKQQSTTLAPDGAGVNAAPGADLSFRNLTMAYLIGANLTGANAGCANLANAELSQANLTNANFSGGYDEFTAYFTDLTGANLSQANLTNASFYYADLTSATLTDAEVRGAYFSQITAAQLYSTASYQAHDLTGIGINVSDLSAVNLGGQNLTNASVFGTLTNANFSLANLTGARIGGSLTGANLAGANLTNASFSSTTLTDANFGGAVVQRANFSRDTSQGSGAGGTGLSTAQLASTASYQAHDLSGFPAHWDPKLRIPRGQVVAAASIVSPKY